MRAALCACPDSDSPSPCAGEPFAAGGASVRRAAGQPLGHGGSRLLCSAGRGGRAGFFRVCRRHIRALRPHGRLSLRLYSLRLCIWQAFAPSGLFPARSVPLHGGRNSDLLYAGHALVCSDHRERLCCKPDRLRAAVHPRRSAQNSTGSVAVHAPSKTAAQHGALRLISLTLFFRCSIIK